MRMICLSYCFQFPHFLSSSFVGRNELIYPAVSYNWLHSIIIFNVRPADNIILMQDASGRLKFFHLHKFVFKYDDVAPKNRILRFDTVHLSQQTFQFPFGLCKIVPKMVIETAQLWWKFYKRKKEIAFVSYQSCSGFYQASIRKFGKHHCRFVMRMEATASLALLKNIQWKLSRRGIHSRLEKIYIFSLFSQMNDMVLSIWSWIRRL